MREEKTVENKLVKIKIMNKRLKSNEKIKAAKGKISNS